MANSNDEQEPFTNYGSYAKKINLKLRIAAKILLPSRK